MVLNNWFEKIIFGFWNLEFFENGIDLVIEVLVFRGNWWIKYRSFGVFFCSDRI